MKDRSTFAGILLTLGLLSWVNQAQATVWYLPTLERPQELWIVNSGKEAETVWISGPNRDGRADQEQVFTIEPNGHQVLSGNELPFDSFIYLKTQEPSNRLDVLIRQPGRWESVPAGRSSRRSLASVAGAQLIRVTNTRPIRQEGKIFFQLREGETLSKTFSVEGFGQWDFSLPEAEFSEVRIEGDSNLIAAYVTRTGLRLFTPQSETTFPTSKRPRFLVQNSDGISFVVEISDPRILEAAREQIRRPEAALPRILFGDIEMGPGQMNQDLKSTLRSKWSWHVSQVTGFGEVAWDGCGTPDFLEEFLVMFAKEKRGFCFGAFRIVREL